MKFNKTLVSLSIMFLLTAVIVSIGFSKARVFDPEMVQQIASAYVPYTSKAAGLEDQTDCYRRQYAVYRERRQSTTKRRLCRDRLYRQQSQQNSRPE